MFDDVKFPDNNQVIIDILYIRAKNESERTASNIMTYTGAFVCH